MLYWSQYETTQDPMIRPTPRIPSGTAAKTASRTTRAPPEETQVKPSRIPAPLNITEVGGYFNLIEQVETTDPALQNQKARMQLALIASALGLPT